VHALDFVLVGKDLVERFGLRKTQISQAMEAISLPSADLGLSYERLEWYGEFSGLHDFIRLICGIIGNKATPVATLLPGFTHIMPTYIKASRWTT
jgi:hypothetical protein